MAEIAGVFPSGPVMSVNTLRLTIRFGRVVAGPLLPRLTMKNESGSTLRDLFVQQELWSPDGTALTLLFDPGRLKSGIGRNKALGAPLQGSSRIRLLLDGQQLKEWRVEVNHCPQLNPDEWQLLKPKAGTRSSLQIRFMHSVDVQVENLLAIVDSAGARVRGRTVLTRGETAWLFQPVSRWAAGNYKVILHPDFENPCGDRIGDSFEHSIQPTMTKPNGLQFSITPSR